MNGLRQYRKIDFRRTKLVICKLAIVVKSEILEYGNRDTWWDYHHKSTWEKLPKLKILCKTKYGEFYLRWEDYFSTKASEVYSKDRFDTEVGDLFVLETNDIPIQFDSRITLTEKEKREGKITLKRIEELEKVINS